MTIISDKQALVTVGRIVTGVFRLRRGGGQMHFATETSLQHNPSACAAAETARENLTHPRSDGRACPGTIFATP